MALSRHDRKESQVLIAITALAGAALAYGAAAVLQAAAVARSARHDLGGLVTGLARDTRYQASFALTGIGFLLSFVAVRTLPLFAVQAGRASSLAVTAVLAAVALGSRLTRAELLALAGVAVGLVAVAVSAAPQSVPHGGHAAPWLTLTAAMVLAGGTLLLARTTDSGVTAVTAAVVAGLAFGVLSVGARLLGPVGLDLLLDPSAWALGLSGLSGLLAGALSLRGGRVVTVTAAMVATEAVTGSLWGLALGDRTADGLGSLAVVGFMLTVGSALTLARFGVPAVAEPATPTPRLAAVHTS